MQEFQRMKRGHPMEWKLPAADRVARNLGRRGRGGPFSSLSTISALLGCPISLQKFSPHASALSLSPSPFYIPFFFASGGTLRSSRHLMNVRGLLPIFSRRAWHLLKDLRQDRARGKSFAMEKWNEVRMDGRTGEKRSKNVERDKKIHGLLPPMWAKSEKRKFLPFLLCILE